MNGEEELFDESPSETGATIEFARKCLPILVEHVLRQQDHRLEPLTYLQLAERLDRKNKNGDFWARGVGRILGRVTSLLDGIAMDWAETIPYLTTIVVAGQGQNKGLPGVGVSDKWHGYEQLTRDERRAKVELEYDRILEFGSRWNDVLTKAGLSPVMPNDTTENRRLGGWGGGESLLHRALKRFVLENPGIVGAGADWFAIEEYALRSGDQIDVFFRAPGQWIAVEVKSSVSDALISDYERGIYQAVKYSAVLNAQAKVDYPYDPPVVRVVLLLQNTLPTPLLEIAHRLGVDVMQNVQLG